MYVEYINAYELCILSKQMVCVRNRNSIHKNGLGDYLLPNVIVCTFEEVGGGIQKWIVGIRDTKKVFCVST